MPDRGSLPQTARGLSDPQFSSAVRGTCVPAKLRMEGGGLMTTSSGARRSDYLTTFVREKGLRRTRGSD